jgi:cytochrome P450
MTVFVSQRVIHVDTDIWGDDAKEFKPSRWIDSTGEIIAPSRGTFLPWSGGPRVCPGMKMAQVEFVATFATLFRSGRCEVITGEQETQLEAKKRIEDMMADSVLRLTMQMKHPEKLKLRWIEDGA